MKLDKTAVLICNCEKTMPLDETKLAAALGSEGTAKIHTHLCRTGIAAYSDALRNEEELLVCCTQEAPLFLELAEAAGHGEKPAFVNIRERAGWSESKNDLSPKIAALIAEARVTTRPAGLKSYSSDGLCLVYGPGEAALEIARKLQGRLSPSVLLTSADDIIPPSIADLPVYRGKVRAAAGHFGNFEIIVDGYAPVVPSSKQQLSFVPPRDEAASSCAIIIDVSGQEPLFSGRHIPDGYFRLDPDDKLAVAEALFSASNMVGEFEKPLYVTYEPDICAHSRARQTGCSRCLDSCPLSAVSSIGDHIAVDDAICGGCGACASACPTGAISYTLPYRDNLQERVAAALKTYLAAGGTDPQLLLHDEDHGSQAIALMARFGRGLPDNVLPISVNEVTALGHDFLAAALAMGANRLHLLINPQRRDELDVLHEQIGLITTILSAMDYDAAALRVTLIDEQDPDHIETALWTEFDAKALPANDFLPTTHKRQGARTAFWLLNSHAPSPQEVIALEKPSPYGRIKVDSEGCTLCLACVSACPAAAMRDNPDLPQLRFIEQDCVQCGLCANTCPENVITLEARLNLDNDAMTPVIINEEEPAECSRCGRAFGTKSSIERIVAQLAGKHAMFQSQEAQQLIRMCDNCRIEHQADTPGNPFALGERPTIRRTEDYLAERDDAANGDGEE